MMPRRAFSGYLDASHLQPKSSQFRTAQAASFSKRSPGKMNQAERVAEMRERVTVLFDAIDKDGSGSISVNEIGMLLKLIGVERTPEQLRALMAEADRDGSGDLDADEFIATLEKQMQGGGGELAGLVNQSASFFGISLNPFAWFASRPAPSTAETSRETSRDTSFLYGRPSETSFAARGRQREDELRAGKLHKAPSPGLPPTRARSRRTPSLTVDLRSSPAL